MQGKKVYQEKLFVSFRLSDRVPLDNFYRRLNEVLDLNWLYKATSKYYGTEGPKSIDPTVFFKLALIGYFENFASDRRIIDTVSMRMDLLLFIGYDIDEQIPWHSTISRTRQLYDKVLFKELFQRVLAQCIDKGMVAGHRQAIDSVFMKANASMDSLVAKDILEKGLFYIDDLCSQDNKVDEAAGTEREGAVESKTNVKLNHRYRSSTDADARVSTKQGKSVALNYLTQVSVDTASHVITNIDVHHADKGDSHCLEEVLEQTQSNLEANGLKLEEVLADTGYSSGAVLQYLEDKNIEGYIPNKRGYKPEREGFTYDIINDEYICSQGKVLSFKGSKEGNKGCYRKIYMSSSADCSVCPLRSQCIGKSPTKKISVSEQNVLFDKMAKKLQTRKGKRMCRLRGSTVEPVIGTLSIFLAMKRVNTIGIEQAAKCAVMSACAYNIKKLLKFCPSLRKAIIKVAQQARIAPKSLFSS